MKKKLKIAILFLFIICLCACESKTPLYLAHKYNDIIDDSMSVDEATKMYLENYQPYADMLGLTAADFQVLNNEELEKRSNDAVSFINAKFDFRYTELIQEKNSYTDLLKDFHETSTEFDNEFFIENLIKSKVVYLVSYAEILSGRCIAKYESNGQVLYGIPCVLYLNVSALDMKFYEEYDFVIEGTTLVNILLIVDDNGDPQAWIETYNHLSDTECIFRYEKETAL